MQQARKKVAAEFGATARIKGLTGGIGADDGTLECVGTQESMLQAVRSTRPDGIVGDVASRIA